MAWQSTLYVTNFPERVDDAEIRKVFGKVCCLFRLIFDRLGADIHPFHSMG